MLKFEWSKMCVVSIFLAASATASAGQTFTTLVNFDLTNGSGPNSELVQGRDGNLYGTTGLGGSSSNCTNGCGTVFKVTPSGTLTTLHSFEGTDGSFPTGIVLGDDGNFYGTTSNGGSSSNCSSGCGTVFKITPAGKLTMLYSFGGTDGSGPYSALIQGADRNFYGTTAYGGSSTNCSTGCGTVFQIISSGTLTVLHSFDGNDGSGPNAGLVQGRTGIFYGTTFSGGTTSNGTAFEITAKGSFTTLHNFNGTDGSGIYSGLIQGSDGNFYGTSEVGGGLNDGTAFDITLGGSVTTLHDFGSGADGSNPTGLVLGSDGNFYGTAQTGGMYFFGMVFKMTPKGVVKTLHSFNSYDGTDPQCAPIQATNGKFYGTTFGEGPGGYGTLFSISTGLSPFVALKTLSGKVGTRVTILGMGLTGSTAVDFNGVNATTFSIPQAGEIVATVPADGTTGYITVTTPGRILQSSKKFDVIPQITSFVPTDGPVGTAVTIMGASLTQTTAVAFGGVRTNSFSVISDTELTVTVPSGAKNGKLAVTTSGGSATSSSTFSVTK